MKKGLGTVPKTYSKKGLTKVRTCVPKASGIYLRRDPDIEELPSPGQPVSTEARQRALEGSVGSSESQLDGFGVGIEGPLAGGAPPPPILGHLRLGGC